MRPPTARYRNLLVDSARWDDIVLRDGDIIISTPGKCGTTWLQTICGLLVFQTPEFPRPLDAMSVWPDVLTHRAEDILAELAGQRHRRFLKTHTPLDGLPFDDRVTYVCVGRDPRDAAISWGHHLANLDFPTVMAMRASVVGMDDVAGPPEGDDPPPAPGSREQFWAWVDEPEELLGLRPMMAHLAGFWRVRHLPNVVLLHYDDLREDLDGQMRYLAARLGIEVPAQRWPELVRAATFEHMSGHPHRYTPELAFWRDPRRFFHRGTSGQWREVLDDDDLRRYAALIADLADPELAAWVHRGPLPTD